MRKPDDDLISYLNYNQDLYTLDDIADVLAEVPGHNEDDYWYWVLLLKNGYVVLTEAWCDYTGWDCQSGGKSTAADTIEQLIPFIPEDNDYRQVKSNLLNQLAGKQPIGLEDRRAF